MRGFLALTGLTRLGPLVLRAIGWTILMGASRAHAGANYPCAADDSCTNQTTRSCASGPQVGQACTSNEQCSQHACQENWHEYFIDAGRDMSCAAVGYGGAGADGVDLADFDGDGDIDVVTGWEEDGITYIYSNPFDPSNPGAVYQQWRSPSGPNPSDVRGGASTASIEDAVFADFNLDGRPDGVATANEGENKDVKIHGLTHQGTWLGKELPGEGHLYMQVRVADINGDGCADVVAGNKIAHPSPCFPGLNPDDRCDACDLIGITCDDVGGIWWWECPKVNEQCAPFGRHFGDTPPVINTGNWNKRRIDSGFFWIMGLDLVDMDGDGDRDVLYSDRQEIGWFENRTSPAQGGNLEGWGTPIRIDTKASILARKDGTGFESGQPFRFHAYDDVDGDGLKDVVVTASFSKGFCSITRNHECTVNADCPEGETCPNNGERFAGYYYRRLDIWGRSWTIYPIFVKNGLPYGLDAEDDAKVSKGVAIGDLTGDGRKDLVFAVRGSGHALYLLSFQPASPGQCGPCLDNEWDARPIAPCRTRSKYDNVRLADLDRDGRLDVVTTEENYESDTIPGTDSGLGVVWYRNLGFCGNGSVEGNEECDNGALNGSAAQCCRSDCRFRVGEVCRASTGQCDAPEHCAWGSGTCPPDSKKPQGTPCANGPCDSLPYQCDGNGSCILAPGGAQHCNVHEECPSGICNCPGGQCYYGGICAASCADDGNPCTYDVCNGDICRHLPKPPATICGDDGNECTIQQCDGAGTCRTVFLGTLTHCGQLPTQPCDTFDYCDGAGNCQSNNEPAGTNCGDAEAQCVYQDTCNGSGSCTDNGFKDSGTACGSSADTECDYPDHCSGTDESCEPNYETAGAACGNGADTDCDNPDTCNGSGACQANNSPDGTSCNDGNVCTANDTCSGGACVEWEYPWTGFFQPVDNAPTYNRVKAGSAILLKFSLGCNQGLAILESGYPKSSPVACTGALVVDEIESTVTAGGSSLSYDPVANQYIYVWKTDKAWASTCRVLNVKLADGTSHYAYFNFTK
ncbi:MAG: PxKF domain-containing protein [Planctomycetota bacterium]